MNLFVNKIYHNLKYLLPTDLFVDKIINKKSNKFYTQTYISIHDRLNLFIFISSSYENHNTIDEESNQQEEC